MNIVYSNTNFLPKKGFWWHIGSLFHLKWIGKGLVIFGQNLEIPTTVWQESLCTHIYIQSGTLCKDVGLYFHFIQLFPDNNTNICRTVPQQGGPVWWIPTSLPNYSAPYKSVRLPVGSFNVSKKGSYYILTTAGFSYLAQRFSRDSRNLTQKTCEIVWCQIVFVWFQVIKGAFPKLLNE